MGWFADQIEARVGEEESVARCPCVDKQLLEALLEALTPRTALIGHTKPSRRAMRESEQQPFVPNRRKASNFCSG